MTTSPNDRLLALGETLQAAQVLLTRGWARNAHARDVSGAVVDPRSDDARSWSVVGAVTAAAPDADAEALAHWLLDDSTRQSAAYRDGRSYAQRLQGWNDRSSTTQRQAVELVVALARRL